MSIYYTLEEGRAVSTECYKGKPILFHGDEVVFWNPLRKKSVMKQMGKAPVYDGDLPEDVSGFYYRHIQRISDMFSR